MNTANSPQALIPVTYDADDAPVISGRDLHRALDVKTRYNDWFPRMCEYGFAEGKDYCCVCYSNLSNDRGRGGQNKIDHTLTLSMAKEVCMLQRTDRGKLFREYFIEIEQQWNSPEAVMSRALTIANRRIDEMKVTISRLTVENQIMAPKADYFDELVDRNLLTNFTDAAKKLHVKRKDIIDFLLSHKYIYRDHRNTLKPYATDKAKGMFEIKECYNESTNWVGSQTLLTPKGMEALRLMRENVIWR